MKGDIFIRIPRLRPRRNANPPINGNIPGPDGPGISPLKTAVCIKDNTGPNVYYHNEEDIEWVWEEYRKGTYKYLGYGTTNDHEYHYFELPANG